MRAQSLNRADHDSAVPGRLLCCCATLFCVLMMLGSEPAHAQAGQSASGPNAQQQATQAASQSGQAPVPSNGAAPMIMGENPDSQDTTSAPPQSSGNPAPPAGTSGRQPANPPGGLEPWTPVSPLPGAATAGKHNRHTPAPSAAPAPDVEAAELAEPVPVPPPANAGGDSARQQINNECVDLLKMANELKAEVAKTNRDVLSVSVVRKADQIEQLARQVRGEMKPEVGKK